MLQKDKRRKQHQQKKEQVQKLIQSSKNFIPSALQCYGSKLRNFGENVKRKLNSIFKKNDCPSTERLQAYGKQIHEEKNLLIEQKKQEDKKIQDITKKLKPIQQKNKINNANQSKQRQNFKKPKKNIRYSLSNSRYLDIQKQNRKYQQREFILWKQRILYNDKGKTMEEIYLQKLKFKQSLSLKNIKSKDLYQKDLKETKYFQNCRSKQSSYDPLNSQVTIKNISQVYEKRTQDQKLQIKQTFVIQQIKQDEQTFKNNDFQKKDSHNKNSFQASENNQSLFMNAFQSNEICDFINSMKIKTDFSSSISIFDQNPIKQKMTAKKSCGQRRSKRSKKEERYQ